MSDILTKALQKSFSEEMIGDIAGGTAREKGEGGGFRQGTGNGKIKEIGNKSVLLEDSMCEREGWGRERREAWRKEGQVGDVLIK